MNGRQGTQELSKFGVAALPTLLDRGLAQDIALVVHAPVLVGEFGLGNGGATLEGAPEVFILFGKIGCGLCLCRGFGARLQ